MKLWPRMRDRRFVCLLHSNGLADVSLGVDINLAGPSITIRLPFCWFRIGWQGVYRSCPAYDVGKDWNR